MLQKAVEADYIVKRVSEYNPATRLFTVQWGGSWTSTKEPLKNLEDAMGRVMDFFELMRKTVHPSSDSKSGNVVVARPLYESLLSAALADELCTITVVSTDGDITGYTGTLSMHQTLGELRLNDVQAKRTLKLYLLGSSIVRVKAGFGGFWSADAVDCRYLQCMVHAPVAVPRIPVAVPRIPVAVPRILAPVARPPLPSSPAYSPRSPLCSCYPCSQID